MQPKDQHDENTNNQKPPPTPSKKKTDLTRKDIANLYTQLESVVEKVPSPAPTSPLSENNLTVQPISTSNESPRLSRSASSTSSLQQRQRQPSDCPHRHIFIPNEATCALCDQQIPQMTKLLQSERDLDQWRTQAIKNENKLKQLQKIKQETEQKLNQVTQQLNSTRHDMQKLNDKYVDAIEHVAEIHHAKELVENELEELSQRLFEEANGMVATEKREKSNLQDAYNHLQARLNETRERLSAEEMQLKELRQKVQDGTLSPDVPHKPFALFRSSSTPTFKGHQESQNTEESKSSKEEHQIMSNESNRIMLANRNDPEQTAAYDLAELFRTQLHISTTQYQHPPDGMDVILIEQLADFILSSPTVTLKKVHSLPFLKFCLTEDIEPCLRFGPNSRMSARKLIDAITTNACYIEDTPPGFVKQQAKKHFVSEQPLKISALKLSMWELFSSDDTAGIFQGCQACGRPETLLPYRFRISYMDDWACIDRFCRDRLVAVCEFFVFIRNIRQGYYSKRTLPDLYHEAIRLRLQMFYARMGVLPWIMTSLGVKGNELGTALEPHISVPPTPEGGVPPPSPFKDTHHGELSPQTPTGPLLPPSPKIQAFTSDTSSPNSPTTSSS
ncbi:hypothetical protein BDC45DRAFT_536782 [Circinella umbellata]|nr:hypothetical protein BDC45DRAFT_536782 [Circinella umbellata]